MESPKEPGWYWYRASKPIPMGLRWFNAGEWIIVKVTESLKAHLISTEYNLKELPGQWVGPLLEPRD